MTRRVPELELVLAETGRAVKIPRKVAMPEAAYAVARMHKLHRATQEKLVAIFVDSQNQLIGYVEITRGSLNTTRTTPREIFRPAIQLGAHGVVLMHNHPSGSKTPSADDIAFTEAVRRAGEIMGIEVYDHLIVTPTDYVSMRELGMFGS